MNASGLLWSDSLLVCFFLYVVVGGWVVTLLGWAVCLFVGIASRRWRSAAGLALLGLLPACYMAALGLLALTGRNPPPSDLATMAVLGGMVLATFACPVAAVAAARRTAPRRV